MKTFTTYAEKKAKQFFNLLQGYTKGIRMTAILILLLMGVSNAWAADITANTKLYLEPNSNWKQANARFAAYFFGNGEAWVSMTELSTCDGKTVYEVTSPNKSYTNVIFCRMNPSASANNWDNKWNQTSDLTYDGTKNLYTVKSNTWDKGGGTWSAYTFTVTINSTSNGTINVNSGGSITSVTTSNKTINVVPNSNITVSFTPSTGYELDSYKIQIGNNSERTETSEQDFTICGNTTISATSFKLKTYTVTFGVHSSGNGTLTAQAGSTSISSGTKVNYGSKVIFTATPSTGYQIEGWYSNSNCTTSLNNGTSNTYTISSLTANKTVYVKFIENKFDVTVTATTGGTVTPTAVTAMGQVTGETVTATANTGYHFTKWEIVSGSGSFTNANVASTTFKPTSASTIRATFTANTYKVHFDGNGNTDGSMSDQSFTYNEAAKTLTANTFTKTGYTFAGWNTAADGSGNPYADGASVSNLTTENNATITLYAQWKPNTYAVTLSQEEAATKGTELVTATYDAEMPSITLPTAQNGYAFMGYRDEENGDDKQYYNADGTSANKWDKAEDATLYAYFKKAEISEITLNQAIFDPVPAGGSGSVTATATIDPTPVGDVVICWQLLYNNGNAVQEHEPTTNGNSATFSIAGLAAGSYKIKATLRTGTSCDAGTELHTLEKTFTIASNFTVTVRYLCENEVIAAPTKHSAHATNPTSITAQEIGGYKFKEWILGDGVSSTNDLTYATIEFTAFYNGYLTATYEKKKLIFLDVSKLPNKAQWSAPHVYLYSSNDYWDDRRGIGATKSQCVAKAAMEQVPTATDIWFYEYEGVQNFNGFVAFTATDKISQEYFYDTEVIYRGDFSKGTPVFVPAVGQNAVSRNSSEGKDAKYYSKGHWTKYMGGTGYTLKIYNHKEEDGRKELMSVPFTGSSLYLPFTAIVDLEGGQTFGYKIVRDDDKWYKNDNDGTMTVNSHTNWPFVEDNSNGLACGIQTVAAGNHTFTLTLNATSGNFEVSVDYPVTVGDYRILYKDDTRTTYKPSQIIKTDEAEPIVGYFVRPGKNPKFKVQSAARISDEGVTWYNSDNEIFFKPNNSWKSDGARFAAYFYNASYNKWVDLKANGDLYSCIKPTDKAYTHVIFCRMDPKISANNFNKGSGNPLWNQTRNLSLPTDGKNFYALEEGAWRGQIYLKPNSNWTADGARFAAYFFQDGKDNIWHSMMVADADTYWCDVPEGYTNVIFCRMNPNVQDNNWDQGDGKPFWGMQTSNLQIPTNSNDLYTITNGQNKPTGAWSCKSWNKITGSITDLTEELKEKLGEINGDIGKAPDSVYTIHLSNNEGTLTIEKVAFYTGNFYIRVDAAAGKWYDYKTNPDNLMTYSAFSESKANSFGEQFSHYKTKWCSDGMNVKFVIANDYSPCISDTLVQDTENSFGNIDEYGNLKNEDKYNANIRFMWNRRDNKVSRAYVAGATDDAKKFLVLKTDKKIKNNKDELVNEIIFQDTQNWIYEYTIKAQPGTRVKLYACYPDADEAKAQHFRGEYDNPTTFGESNSVQILGGTGGAWNTIRVLYDFKTNRLMGAWVPESAISTEQAIAADLMVIRRHQENATCVTLTNEYSKLTDVKTAYGAMQFNRWTINNRGGADDLDVKHCTKESGSHRVYDETVTNEYHPVLPLAEQTSIYERGLYFISFPFDVHLSDVFGLGTYGTHWVISTYNGKRRAERGYFAEDCINEDCTNWDYIWDPSSFVMKANEGYLLSLDLDLMKHDNTSFWANNISQVELFFPSTAAVNSIEKTDYTMPDLGEEYLCTINHNTPNGDRRVKDSYWRCIGVPSFADYDGSLTTDGESTINWKDDYTWEADKEVFPFLYEWNVTNNDLVVRSTTSYKFRATYAYLIQNGNEIHWKAVNTNKPASIIARDQTEKVNNYEWKIALLRNDAPADHTFIRMTDNESVTSAFDFHQDLSKEFNYGANIYTLVGYERLAANSLPMSDSTTIIPLGVSAQEAGDYTITMPEGVENIGITLVDNETGIHTNLSAGQEYTLTLNKGICENRLFIEVSPIQQSTTDLEYTTEDTREQTTRKMLIDGILYLIRDGVIYDAQGHRL